MREPSTTFDAGSAPLPLRVLPPAIELRGVGRRYGAVEALAGVDLTVGRGELTAILGPNGAGKTTMLSLILGLRQPTVGVVLPHAAATSASVTASVAGPERPPRLGACSDGAIA